MRLTEFFVMIIIGSMVLSSISFGYSGGTGQPNTPYQIADVDDLLQLAVTTSDYTKYFILTADIDLAGETFTRAVIAPDTNSSTTNFEGTKFTGVFDGNGHTILNLTITGSGSYYVGLFGFVDTGGQVRNLYIKNITIQGRDYTGGLAGGNNGTITYSYTAGSVNGQYYTGGLTGLNYSSSKISFCRMVGTVAGTSYVGGLSGGYAGMITSCCSSGTVSGNTYLGGLAGYGSSGTIDACYSLAVVGSLSSQYVGGLTGYSYNSYIRSCYSAGAVVGASAVGGFTGYYSSGSIEKCFWDTQSSGRSNGFGSGGSSGVVGKTTADMKTLSTFVNAGWSISDLDGRDADWIIVSEGQNYPQNMYFVYVDPSVVVTLTGNGTQQSPYQIASSDDLVSLSRCGSVWNTYIILTANLNMDGFTVRPIGNSVIPFKGNFNGQNHVISNLTLDFPNKDYVGLFGYIGQGGVIADLNIENANLIGNKYVGCLAGYISKSSISNCHLTGVAVGNSSLCLGGLAGFSVSSTIADCHSNVALGGTGSNVGGLVGSSFANSTISNCSAAGAITDNDPNGLNFSVGGLVGNNCSSTITHCSATGNVTVISTSTSDSLSVNIGGLTGEDRFGTISNSYATGSINTVAASESAITCGGGLVGLNSSKEMGDSYAKGSVSFNLSTEADYFIGGMLGLNYAGMVRRCYAAGTMDSSGNPESDNCVGGFCGDLITDAIFEDTGNFWDTESSGIADSTMGIGKTTVEMKALSTFTSAGWDFVNAWSICEGTNYPRLRWQIPAGDWSCPDGVGSEDLSALTSCWMETVQAKADINDDNAVDFGDILLLSQNWLLVDCDGCNGADITGDNTVDGLDLAQMAEQWLILENAGCRMMDLNADGGVDLGDWAVFAGNWIEGI